MGGLISFLISLMFFYFGVKKYRQHKKIQAVILLLLGVMFTGGWLPALIGMVFSLIITLALLAGGVYLVLKLINKLKDNDPDFTFPGSRTETRHAGQAKMDDGFDDDWKAFLKKQGK
ncbi:hypothetical protein CIG75_03260 [Tumebacillus algifaecis]|uniref:Uncharacterized protein n=1 Tax=Tumebacillus algifaecis TaxID=1214604 RepID=A0A223CXS9_9BACL|nr:hypothetical protein [Tumebacillus algifaecis]ASS74101.1 hypothetical protein CIG75_03260 [Tumebacillus algifaecis]